MHQFKDPSNVWVVSLLENLELIPVESFQYLVPQTRLFDNLDCAGSQGLDVPSFVDTSKAPLAQ